jgi:hypothetical protein
MRCLVSHLLKSNCPVTGQPDWASVQIAYQRTPARSRGLAALPDRLPATQRLPRALCRAHLAGPVAAVPPNPIRSPCTRATPAAADWTSTPGAAASQASRTIRAGRDSRPVGKLLTMPSVPSARRVHSPNATAASATLGTVPPAESRHEQRLVHRHLRHQHRPARLGRRGQQHCQRPDRRLRAAAGRATVAERRWRARLGHRSARQPVR